MRRRLSLITTEIYGINRRSVASYGSTFLSHMALTHRYAQQSTLVPLNTKTKNVLDTKSIGPTKSFAAAETFLPLLQQVESIIGKWRLNRWEFRTPALLTQEEKEAALAQLHVIKTLVFDQQKTQLLIDEDISVVCKVLGVPKEELLQKNRLWLQEKVDKLRWEGQVNQATDVRQRFLRLEKYGAPDFRILERLCCVYGLAKFGTFEDGFSNTIVVDPSTKSPQIQRSNPFVDLMTVLVSNIANLDILYDFIGFNASDGYRQSLGKYMNQVLRMKPAADDSRRAQDPNGISAAHSESSRILFCAGDVILFDFKDSRSALAQADAVQGVVDFVFVRGADITLITIATSNAYQRTTQLPHRKQLEGIARRASFVLRIPYDSVRIKNLLLPPLYLDRGSLDRLNRVLDVQLDAAEAALPWLPLYEKELDRADVDFTEVAKKTTEEEWVKL